MTIINLLITLISSKQTNGINPVRVVRVNNNVHDGTGGPERGREREREREREIY